MTGRARKFGPLLQLCSARDGQPNEPVA